MAVDLALSGAGLDLNTHARVCVHANAKWKSCSSFHHRLTLEGENNAENPSTLLSTALTIPDLPVLHRPLQVGVRVARSIHCPPSGQAAVTINNGFVDNDGFDVQVRIVSPTATPSDALDPFADGAQDIPGCTITLHLPRLATSVPHNQHMLTARRISVQFDTASKGDCF